MNVRRSSRNGSQAIQSRQKIQPNKKSQQSRVLTRTTSHVVSRGLRLGRINHEKPMANEIYKVPSRVLFGLGIYDLVRGFMHTFLL